MFPGIAHFPLCWQYFYSWLTLVWIFLCHIVSNFKGCLSHPLCCFLLLLPPLQFFSKPKRHSATVGVTGHWAQSGGVELICRWQALSLQSESHGNPHIKCYYTDLRLSNRNVKGGWGWKKRDSRHGKDRGGVNNNRFVFAHLPVNYFSVFIAFTKRSDSCFWVTRCSLVYKLMVPNDSSQCTVIKSSILQGNLSSLKI